MASFRADRRLYVDAARERVVEEGDPDAAFLLAGVNRILGPDAIERYGLEQADDGTVVIPGDEPEEKSVDAPENKMQGPSEDKSVEDEDATSAAEGLADEHGLDLADIEGSGKDGRVLKSDVQAAVEGA